MSNNRLPLPDQEFRDRFEAVFNDLLQCDWRDYLTPEYWVQTDDENYRMDYAFVRDGHRIGIELDGRDKFFRYRNVFDNFFYRHREIQLVGYSLWRFTWTDVSQGKGQRARRHLARIFKGIIPTTPEGQSAIPSRSSGGDDRTWWFGAPKESQPRKKPDWREYRRRSIAKKQQHNQPRQQNQPNSQYRLDSETARERCKDDFSPIQSNPQGASMTDSSNIVPHGQGPSRRPHPTTIIVSQPPGYSGQQYDDRPAKRGFDFARLVPAIAFSGVLVIGLVGGALLLRPQTPPAVQFIMPSAPQAVPAASTQAAPPVVPTNIVQPVSHQPAVIRSVASVGRTQTKVITQVVRVPAKTAPVAVPKAVQQTIATSSSAIGASSAAKPQADEVVAFNQATGIYHNPGSHWGRKCTRNCIYIRKSEAEQMGGRASRANY